MRRSINGAALPHNPPSGDSTLLQHGRRYGGMAHPHRRPAPVPIRLAVLCLLALLGGCASTSVPWQNPDLPKEQWSRDWSSCRRWAESQVGFRDDEAAGPFREFDRAQAKKTVAGYANLCMTDRGYSPAPKK